MTDESKRNMAKTKKTDDARAAAKPRAAAPRRRTPRKAVPSAEAPPVDLARVSTTQPIAVASDMSVPATPEGNGDAGRTTVALPSHDEIAEAAYHRYLQRGGGHGMDFEDWLEAERTLQSRR
jgi:hypothetical protein